MGVTDQLTNMVLGKKKFFLCRGAQKVFLFFNDSVTKFGDDAQLVTALAGHLTLKSKVLNINSEHPYRNGGNDESE